MQRPSHIYWFSYFDETEPSVRYRACFCLNTLQGRLGVPHSLFLPRKTVRNILRFCRLFLAALFRKRTAIVVIQKVHTAGLYARALQILVRLRPTTTIYDTDDADYLRFPAQTIHWFMRRCACVTAGSDALVRYAAGLGTPGTRVTSPVLAHGQLKQARNAHFTIGWIGYYGAHRANLETLLFPAVSALRFPVTLLLLGIGSDAEEAAVRQYFAAAPQVDLCLPRDIDWLDEESVYRQLARCDAGAAPLLDTEMNRAKSAFKLKQFLSCGIPVVGSPVGENQRFLHAGYNGFFCETAADFARALTHLAALGTTAYNNLCNNARKSATAFSLEAVAQTLLDACSFDQPAIPPAAQSVAAYPSKVSASR